MPPPKPSHGGGCGDDAADKYDCPPSPPSSHGNRRLVTALVVTASVLVFIFLTFSIYCFIRRRRRQQRQRQEALLAAAPTANVDTDDGGGPVDEEEEVVHHAWHILTVGIDEAAIESIALTRYRAGAGMLGAADCSVCLAEFMDGELVRLLPKCGHAFHVPCIDTWLRAHVNCPLCRAGVLDPAAAAGEPAPPTGANTTTATEQAASNTETMEHEQPGQQQGEEQDLRVEIDHRDQFSSPEPPHRHPASRAQIFRRVASMNDSSLVPGEEAAPEDEQHNSKAKQGIGDTDCCKVSSGSGRLYHMKRSLSGGGRWTLVSRHCRTRSAMLPL